MTGSLNTPHADPTESANNDILNRLADTRIAELAAAISAMDRPVFTGSSFVEESGQAEGPLHFLAQQFSRMNVPLASFGRYDAIGLLGENSYVSVGNIKIVVAGLEQGRALTEKLNQWWRAQLSDSNKLILQVMRDHLTTNAPLGPFRDWGVIGTGSGAFMLIPNDREGSESLGQKVDELNKKLRSMCEKHREMLVRSLMALLQP